MNEPFAKLFGTDGDQILVKLDENEECCPEVRIYFQPPNLGVCSLAPSFEDSDAGWVEAQVEFVRLDEPTVRALIAGYVKTLEGV